MYISLTVLVAIIASVNAANEVKQQVTYSAPGAADVGGNGFGCAHITPKGKGSQLGCVKHVFTDGFTVGITPESTKKPVLCSISGTSGACGPNGVNVTVDLTGGTGKVPAPSGPEGTTNLTAAELVNKPIADKRTVSFEA